MLHRATLAPVPRPAPLPPELPGRLGIGPAASRHYGGTPLEDRWSNTIVIELQVAAGGNEQYASRLIQQPFRVNNFWVHSDDATGGNLMWILNVDPEGPTTPTVATTETQSFMEVYSDASSTKQVRLRQMYASIRPGTIIRNVPTKLVLAVFSFAASARFIAAFIDVTYLAPVDHHQNPGLSCQGCRYQTP